jgi:hypothetical protein
MAKTKGIKRFPVTVKLPEYLVVWLKVHSKIKSQSKLIEDALTSYYKIKEK